MIIYFSHSICSQIHILMPSQHPEFRFLCVCVCKTIKKNKHKSDSLTKHKTEFTQ